MLNQIGLCIPLCYFTLVASLPIGHVKTVERNVATVLCCRSECCRLFKRTQHSAVCIREVMQCYEQPQSDSVKKTNSLSFG